MRTTAILRGPRIAWMVLCLATLHVGLCSAASRYQPLVGDPLVEPWRWRAYPELSGLDTQCMAEGPGGVLWFGSAEGLWSYDGLNWVFHTPQTDGLTSVTTLCRGADGAFYAGGRWGIRQLRSDGQWATIFERRGPGSWDVKKIVAGPDGSIWAATSQGALRFKNSKWTLFTDAETDAQLKSAPPVTSHDVQEFPPEVLAKQRSKSEAFHRGSISEISIGLDGRVWFGTENGEILCFSPATKATSHEVNAADAEGTWSLYNETDGMACGRLPSILPLQDGSVWVVYGAGSGSLNVFDGTTWKNTPLAAEGLPDDGANLLQTRDGVVWLSGRYVLCAWRKGHWRTYTKPDFPIPSARNLIIQSTDGALWIAGSGTVIERIDYQTATWLTLQDLNFQWESPAGAQWFLHRNGRVVVHEGKAWTSYGVEDGVIDTPVAMLGTRQGEVWVAGSHGEVAASARFDGHVWTRTVHEGFSWGIESRGLFESSDGSVWLSAAVDSSAKKNNRAGILQFHNGQWIHHHQPGRALENGDDRDPTTLLPATQRPEPIGKFIVIGESPGGRIWAGRNILISREHERWSVTPPAWMPAGSAAADQRPGVIETMLTTREGELWIGYRQSGVLRFDGKRWQQLRGKDSLVANSVRSIAQTTDGSIWVATDRDVSRFDGRSWTADLLPAPLGIPLDGGNLKTGASGQLWINRLEPEWLRRGHAPPRAGTNRAEFWTVCHEFRGLPPQTVMAPASEKVPPGGNLSVSWSATEPWREGSDSRVQFSFRLDDRPWSAFTTELSHSFFSLPTGRHHLEVRARDRGFNVDPTPAALDFVVLPPVWQQSWFILLMVVLFGLIAAQSTRVYLERERLRAANQVLANQIDERERAEEALRKLNSELDLRVRARTAQLEATNKELEAFSYSVSHDLRAPLRGIDGFSKILLADYASTLDAEGKDYLQRVRAGAQRMSQLIDDMLSLSRVTRDGMKIQRVNLSGLARDITTTLAAQEPERKVSVAIADQLIVHGDARFLRMALQNLLSNAWKFTSKRADAKIEFGAMNQADQTIYFVRDNGAGFDMELSGQLFRAFRRLHTEEEFPGTGIGLATVRRIISRHGGRVWAEARLDEGATIYFTLSKTAEELGSQPTNNVV